MPYGATMDKTNTLFKEGKKEAFNGKIRSYRIELCGIQQSTINDNKDRVRAILNEKINTIANHLEEALIKHDTIQATIKLKGSNDEYDYKTLSFKATKVLDSIDFTLNKQMHLETFRKDIQWKFDRYDSNNEGSIHFHHLYLYIHEVFVQGLQSDDDKTLISAVVKYINGVAYPVQLDDIPMIEERNKLSINVYTKKRGELEGPVYHTQNRKKLHINLLLSEENGRYQYSYHDFNDKYPITSEGRQFCDGCFGYYDKNDIAHHQNEECMKVKTTFPEQKTVKFCDKGYSEKLPFIVYAYIESLDLPVNNSDHQESKRQNNVWITNTHIRLPHSYGYYIKCVDDKFCNKRINCWQQECVLSFTENLVSDLKEQWSKYKSEHPEASIKYVPVILQNLKENGNFLVQNSKCSTILMRVKKYLAVIKKSSFGDGANSIDIRFLDFQGLTNESLQDAVKKLEEVGLKNMPLLFEEKFTDKVKMMSKMLFFPYDYIKSEKNLTETSLPTFQDEVDYEYARTVWKSFQCKNIGDYLDILIRSEINQAANVIENLRDFCRNHYDLDPAHYFTIAGLTWDAMLRMTKVELELLADVEMIHFIKKGIRGGYVQCNKRHAVAYNKYLTESLEEKEDKSYIMYFDANNLYGHIMCQDLPYGGFKWVDVNVNYNVAADSDVGYILEVDLSYPSELHDKHSDLPFCPKKRNVYGADNEFLVADFLPKTRYIIHHSYLALCVKAGLEVKKTHRVLEFNQKPWLKKYIEFNIEMRKKATTKCEEDFFKLLINCIYGKTMVNPLNYSKVQLFHQFDDKDNKTGACTNIARPDCSSYTICSESTVAVEFQKTNLVFRYPIYVGFCILDLAKTHMYKFHYNLKKYKFHYNLTKTEQIGDNLRLLYTDTDSLLYEFRNVDSYEFVKNHVTDSTVQESFDTSGYGSDNIFGIPEKNCKKPGYFKDVFKGAIVTEFVGVRSKTYSVRYKSQNESFTVIKAMMVPKSIKDKFGIKEYRNCVLNDETVYDNYKRNKAFDYSVYKQDVKRIILSPNDPKKHLIPRKGKVDTMPFGHKALSS